MQLPNTNYQTKLDDIDWNIFDDGETERQNETLMFSVNPMLAMYFKTIQGNTDMKYAINFTEVFYEDKLLKVNKQQTGRYKKYIDEVLKYFAEDIATQKLLGYSLSDWQTELGTFIKMCDNNTCKRKHLAMFVKLPFFYQEEQTFIDLSNRFESVEDSDAEIDYRQFRTELKPVTFIKRHSRFAKQKEYYYLTDRSGRLYEYCDTKNETTKSIIFNVWKDFVPVDVVARVKTKASIQNKWYYTENFSIKNT